MARILHHDPSRLPTPEWLQEMRVLYPSATHMLTAHGTGTSIEDPVEHFAYSRTGSVFNIANGDAHREAVTVSSCPEPFEWDVMLLQISCPRKGAVLCTALIHGDAIRERDVRQSLSNLMEWFENNLKGCASPGDQATLDGWVKKAGP